MQRNFIVHVERDGFRQIKDYNIKSTSLKVAIQKTADRWTNGDWNIIEVNPSGAFGHFSNKDGSIKFTIKREE